MKVSTTEEQIKYTAKNVFFKEGRFTATTQDIADTAGVARTLVHYYFRSRSVLFRQVVLQAMLEIEKAVELLFVEEVPFKVKIENFINAFLTEAIAYPYLETYLVLQLNQHFSGTDKINYEYQYKKIQIFMREVEQEVQKGTIESIKPVQFVLNLFSLIAHPVAMQPLFKKFLKINDQKFSILLIERKAIIMQTLFKNSNF